MVDVPRDEIDGSAVPQNHFRLESTAQWTTPLHPSLSLLGTPNSSPPLPSRPDLDLSSGNNLLSTLVAILVRSLAMPRSERPYSPGR